MNVWLDFDDGKAGFKSWKIENQDSVDWVGTVQNDTNKSGILNGPTFIKKHYVWTMDNSAGGGSISQGSKNMPS